MLYIYIYTYAHALYHIVLYQNVHLEYMSYPPHPVNRRLNAHLQVLQVILQVRSPSGAERSGNSTVDRKYGVYDYGISYDYITYLIKQDLLYIYIYLYI